MASEHYQKHLFTQLDLWLALDEAARVSGEHEFIVVGSQAILGSFPYAPEVLRLSTDIDLFARSEITLDVQRKLLKELGAMSPFIETHRWEIEPIGEWVMLTALPNWRDRLVKTETPGGVIGWCISPLDIAYNKAEAGRPKDTSYCSTNASSCFQKCPSPNPEKVIRTVELFSGNVLLRSVMGSWLTAHPFGSTVNQFSGYTLN